MKARATIEALRAALAPFARAGAVLFEPGDDDGAPLFEDVDSGLTARDFRKVLAALQVPDDG